MNMNKIKKTLIVGLITIYSISITNAEIYKDNYNDSIRKEWDEIIKNYLKEETHKFLRFYNKENALNYLEIERLVYLTNYNEYEVFIDKEVSSIGDKYFLQFRLKNNETLENAIIQAWYVRFLPIMLTSVSAIFWALKIAWDPVWSWLAWSIVFWLWASAILTLIVIPIFYYDIQTKKSS